MKTLGVGVTWSFLVIQWSLKYCLGVFESFFKKFHIKIKLLPLKSTKLFTNVFFNFSQTSKY